MDIEVTQNTQNHDTRKKRIPCRRELLVISLQKFYNNQEGIDEIVKILCGESQVSLRLIDWFVTNYAKKYNTHYDLMGQDFLVYLNYKSQLKAYSKKLFDPFCRRERIQFQCANYSPFITTIGQLNFFRWAYEKKIIQYIQANYDAIVREEKQARYQGTQSSTGSNSSSGTLVSTESTAVESLQTLSSANSNSSTRSRRRRTEKIAPNNKMIQHHNMEIRLSFD